MTPTEQLRRFDALRDEFLALVEPLPPEAVAFRRAGDDYTLGGLIPHVTWVLLHYDDVLQAMAAADFAAVDAPERPEDGRVKAGLADGQLAAAAAEVRAAHQRLAGRLGQHLEDWQRSAPVTYGPGAEPYPTRVADILGWCADHYREHIPHVTALVQECRTLQVVDQFNAAFNAHDADGVMKLMTDDVVFDNTYPPPDGERFEGHAAVRAFWERFFRETPSARFTAEEIFGDTTRATVRWRFDWDGGHVRGVDVIKVRDGKLAEKLSYVKG